MQSFLRCCAHVFRFVCSALRKTEAGVGSAGGNARFQEQQSISSLSDPWLLSHFSILTTLDSSQVEYNDEISRRGNKNPYKKVYVGV